MATELEELLVVIDASTEKLRREMKRGDKELSKFNKRAEKNTEQISRHFKRMGVALGAALVTRGTTGFLKWTTDAASRVEEMESKFNTVFRGLAKDVDAWAQEHAESVNRSVYDLKGYAATLQDTFVPMGLARDEAASLSKQMVELAVDVASFNDQADDEAIRDFQSALVGNHETMRKYGVVITQAALDQELMNMGLRVAAKDASEQQKVMARYNIILKGTKDAQGDAAKTSDSFANKMKGLDAAAENAAVAIGEQLLPVASDLLGVLTDITNGIAAAFSDSEPVFLFGGALKDARAEAAALRAELKTLNPQGTGGRENPDARRARAIRARLGALESQDPDIAMRRAREELARQRARLSSVESGDFKIGGRRPVNKDGLIESINAEITALETLIARIEDLRAAKNNPAGGGDGGNSLADETAADLVQLGVNNIHATNYEAEIYNKNAAAIQAYNDALADKAEALRLSLDPAYALQQQVDELNELYNNGAIGIDAYNAAMARMQQDALLTADTLEGAMARAMEDLEYRLSEIDWLSGNIFGQMGNVVKQAVNEMISEFMRLQVIKPLINGIFDGLGGGGGIFSGLFGGGKAKGGPVTGGTPYLVGEKGPEIFVPGSSGGIVPNDRLPSNDNSQGVNIVQHLHFDVGLESVEAKIRQAEPRIAKAAAAGVRDAQHRTGGAFLA